MKLFINKDRLFWNIVKLFFSYAIQNYILFVAYYWVGIDLFSIDSLLIYISYFFFFFAGTLPDTFWFYNLLKNSKNNDIDVDMEKKAIIINNKIYTLDEIVSVESVSSDSPFRIRMIWGYYYKVIFNDGNSVIIPNLRLNSKTEPILKELFKTKRLSKTERYQMYWWK